MIIAIHQPNFLPWLGYFAKLTAADRLVLLDDAQFSKNSYINRVKVSGPSGPAWLTVPVKVSLGQTIAQVTPARADWAEAAGRKLEAYYRKAAAFREVHPVLCGLLAEATAQPHLAAINGFLLAALARRLGISTPLIQASTLGHEELAADDRLVALVHDLACGGTYLSGKGGAGYQDPEKFAQAGLTLRYLDFTPPPYDQGASAFSPGLSVVDALYHLGFAGTARLLGVGGNR